MRLHLTIFGIEVAALELSVPRLGILPPGFIPDSIEALETWAAEHMIEEETEDADDE